MGRSAEAGQEQQEQQENESGMDKYQEWYEEQCYRAEMLRKEAKEEAACNESGIQDYEMWCAENEGKFVCPYCGGVSGSLQPCCGEMHSIVIEYKSAKEMCEKNHKTLAQFEGLITTRSI